MNNLDNFIIKPCSHPSGKTSLRSAGHPEADRPLQKHLKRLFFGIGAFRPFWEWDEAILKIDSRFCGIGSIFRLNGQSGLGRGWIGGSTGRRLPQVYERFWFAPRPSRRFNAHRGSGARCEG